jgi:2',3'-cyclic-nucleotide 2'-phosphodiesterase / 3'-nucleotidase
MAACWRLRILATSDLHCHIEPWDDLTDQPAPGRGLAQIATLIDKARRGADQSILLDNGDFLTGSPLADFVAQSPKRAKGAIHPMIRAMNALGYEAVTLGNHEFSLGLDYLHAALRDAAFPVISTNLDRITVAGPRAFKPRYRLIERRIAKVGWVDRTIKIGVLGFLPQSTVHWEKNSLKNRFAIRDIVDTARDYVPRLRRAGADIIVALAHSGLPLGDEPPNNESLAGELTTVAGIDAVIAGHTHQTFPADGQPVTLGADKVPVVMPGFYGSHLGIIDLDLVEDRAGWRIVQKTAALWPVSERQGADGHEVALVAPDPQLQALAAVETQAMRRATARVIGKSAVALHSYFALIGHCPVQSLIALAARAHAERMLTRVPGPSLPLLISVSPFKCGGRGGPENYLDIPAGDLSVRNIADLYIHPNTGVVIEVSGAEVIDWLERTVSLFHQIPAGSTDRALLNPAFPAFNFDILHGVSFIVDLTQPARFDPLGRCVNPDACRIVTPRFDGALIDPEARFHLFTTSYRSVGGAGFAGTNPAKVLAEDPLPLRQALQDFVEGRPFVDPGPCNSWRLAAMPGTSVTLDLGPGALAHRSVVDGLSVVGPLPSGFVRFRLAL